MLGGSFSAMAAKPTGLTEPPPPSRDRTSRVRSSLAGLAAAILGGCARYSVRDEDLSRVERGEFAPGQAVFICHGMLFDLGFPWDFRLRNRLAEGGEARLTVVTTYYSDPTGVWFNWGRRPPGRIVAELAETMEDLHRSSGCPAPLSLRAVGF